MGGVVARWENAEALYAAGPAQRLRFESTTRDGVTETKIILSEQDKGALAWKANLPPWNH